MGKRLKDFIRSRPETFTPRLLKRQARKRGIRTTTQQVREAKREVEDENE